MFTFTNKSIRFPDSLIEKVKNAVCGTDCTFSVFVIAAVRNALYELNKETEQLAKETSSEKKISQNHT